MILLEPFDQRTSDIIDQTASGKLPTTSKAWNPIGFREDSLPNYTMQQLQLDVLVPARYEVWAAKREVRSWKGDSMLNPVK